MKLENTRKIMVVFAILFVIAIYTIIKVPYFNQNFTGEHSMKYSSYVEPAIHMVEEKNPFSYKQTYRSNPVTESYGEREILPQFPIIEWKIASMMNIFPNLTIEQNTRIFMHIIGVLILIFSFLFIKEWLNRTAGIIAALLLATNPIFNLSTFVTVYDSIILLFLLISLYFLTLYTKKRKPIYLLSIAGVFAGLGIAAKVTLLLWLVPVVLIFLFFKSPNLYTKIFDFLTFLLFMAIPYLITKWTIPNLNQDFLLNSFFLFLGLLFLIFLTTFLQRKKVYVLSFLKKLNEKKLLIPSIVLTAMIGIPLSGYLLYSPNIVEEFLTDRKLIFNFEVYFFIFKQFVRHLGVPLAILSVSGLFLNKFIKTKDVKILTFAFLVSGIFFVFSSSKAIFFHDYYTVFLMFIAILFATICIDFIIKRFKNFLVSFLISIAILLVAVVPRISHTQERLGYEKENFDEALEYFIKNTEENDFYIDEVQATYFSLYSKRPRVGDLTSLEDVVFKESVRDIGWSETMKEYNIKYLITFSDEPDYARYVNIFSDRDLKRPTYRRSDLILSIVNPEKYNYFEDMDVRDQIIKEFNIQEKFVLEKEIGDFKFWVFKD